MTGKLRTSVSFCGMTLSNPLILAAGPYGRDDKTLERAAKAGFGAVTTKTIRPVAAKNPFPNVARIGKDTLINAEKWSDLPLRTWVERIIPLAKRLSVPLIASVGFTAREAEKIAPKVEEAGADFVETVTYDAEEILPMVRAVKSAVEVPVIVKLSANWPDPVKTAVKAERLGADAVSAIDSLGPVLAIDVDTGKPFLGSVNGQGWLSGSAIHPVAVRFVADISRKVKIPVVGIGGVLSGRDVAETIMAGACCVGLCTAPIIHGLQVVERIKKELIEFMEQKNYRSMEEMCGIAFGHTEKQAEQHIKLCPQIDGDTCTLCRLCVNLCPYQALTIDDKKVLLDQRKCLGCGLCYSACPHHAIKLLGR